MSTLKSRLDGHFIACGALAAAGALGGFAKQADATIIYSGAQNIAVPNDFLGIYLDLVTHAQSNSSSTTPTFDTNPFYGGLYMYAGGNGTLADTSSGEVLNLSAGTIIGPSSAGTFYAGTTFMDANFGPGVAGFYGVIFANEVNSTVDYGWVHIIRNDPNNADAGVIIDWAYEDSGASIPAGAVPTPGSLALLAIGAAGLGKRRRR